MILQAANPIEALRLRPARLFVIRRGRVIAETPPVRVHLALDDGPAEVDFTRPTASGIS